MAALAWLLAYWWLAVLAYGAVFVLIAAHVYRATLRQQRADDELRAQRLGRTVPEWGTVPDAGADAGADAYRDYDGDRDSRANLAAAVNRLPARGPVLRACGCGVVGAADANCPRLCADAEAVA